MNAMQRFVTRRIPGRRVPCLGPQTRKDALGNPHARVSMSLAYARHTRASAMATPAQPWHPKRRGVETQDVTSLQAWRRARTEKGL